MIWHIHTDEQRLVVRRMALLSFGIGAKQNQTAERSHVSCVSLLVEGRGSLGPLGAVTIYYTYLDTRTQ